ncbi:MAG: ATP-binding cassette domain-containing protein [Polyangiaceae bacterium]
MKAICLRGARTHNLKGVDLDLFPGELVALAGPSGAGKSSLAIDTLYAEGQRRFIESFSPYARQFLERLERPPIERLDPVAAGVAVDRRAPAKSSRSTVSTLSDLEPYVSALFYREARPVCDRDGTVAVRFDAHTAMSRVLEAHSGGTLVVTYPERAASVEAYLDVRERLMRDGLHRLWLDGKVTSLDELKPSQALSAAGPLRVIVDRVSAKPSSSSRLQAAIEQSFSRGEGRCDIVSSDEIVPLVSGLTCPKCGQHFESPSPGVFSAESPLGACVTCRGFGRVLGIDLAKVIPDPTLSLAKGAIRPWRGNSTTWERAELGKLCRRHGIDMKAPYSLLSKKEQKLILDGDGSWEEGMFPGVLGWFRWLETRTYKMHVRVLLSRYRAYDPCPSCDGKRRSPRALQYRIGELTIADFSALEVTDALAFTQKLSTETAQGELARKELASRLTYLERVGLGYLRLDRQARTLSGGEAQRVTLTAALGTSLHHALFVLDEPTVGLHPTDIPPLFVMMRELARRSNVVLVVEHDPQVLAFADRIVELGPGAGARGGEIRGDGTPTELYSMQGATARALATLVDSEAPREAARPSRAEVEDTSGESVVATSRRRSTKDVDEGNVARKRAAAAETSPDAARKRAAGVRGGGKAGVQLGAKESESAVVRRVPTQWLKIEGARANNLKNIDVAFPLQLLTCVTGPSGSGKSTLVMDILARAVARGLGQLDVEVPLEHDRIRGAQSVKGLVLVDQAPLGRTSRGNAATYTKAWDVIRKLYAAEPMAEELNLTPSSFSFNVAGGRCEACSGEGAETVEMQFLADVRLSCSECGGRRFRPEVCEVRHRGRSIDQLLETTIEEVLALYASEAAIVRTLGPLSRLGLGYLRLGQPLSTLSGGEAQRLKLARALTEAKPSTLYLLDEPSAGLHADEVGHVLDALQRLVELGGTVIVVDHDVDVMRAADHIVDLGPGAGREGGQVTATGTPEAIAASKTKTGAALSYRLSLPRQGKTKSERRDAAGALVVERAKEHNLREVSCEIPHGKLTVITGPSGSGKSSLAFDVIFAEGQRRFFETLTPYARQFLPTLPRPNVDAVRGVPPTIALEQRTSRAGGGSTVATITEVAHFLRLLYAKIGVPHCPTHDVPIAALSLPSVLEAIRALPKRKLALLAPVVRARKGTYLDVFASAAKAGIAKAYCDGELVETDNPPKLKRSVEHDIDLVVVDQVMPIAVTLEALESVTRLAKGEVKVRFADGTVHSFSTKSACPTCGFSVTELDPRWFSPNTRQGRCPTCEGHGVVTRTEKRRGKLEEVTTTCASCSGSKLSPLARSVRVNGVRYPELLSCDVEHASRRISEFAFSPHERPIAEPLVGEVTRRLRFLEEVGLGYLALAREALTLSGGELQRLRLAAQLGAGLTGALYVLDEPTIGLHPRDTHRLLSNLRKLVDLGSTVLVVEHDIDTIRAADRLIDIGPGGGTHGGTIVAAGSPREVMKNAASPTGKALARSPKLREALPVKKGHPMVVLEGAREHNLKGDRFRFPLGRMTVVAGVSGSGKSTLVRQVLLPAVRQALGLTDVSPGAFSTLSGTEPLKRALSVDQSPIGRSPRSVPATFLGISGRDPSHLRRHAGGADPRVFGFALLFQYRERRSLSGVRGTRRHHGSHELLARRSVRLRGLWRRALRAANSRGSLSRPNDRRRARSLLRAGDAPLRTSSENRRASAHFGRTRDGVREAGPGLPHLERWRSPAAQIGFGAYGWCPPRAHALRARRTYDGVAPRRRRSTPRRAISPRRSRGHLGDHRASPADHRWRGLHRRARSRGGRARRARRSGRLAREARRAWNHHR